MLKPNFTLTHSLSLVTILTLTLTPVASSRAAAGYNDAALALTVEERLQPHLNAMCAVSSQGSADVGSSVRLRMPVVGGPIGAHDAAMAVGLVVQAVARQHRGQVVLVGVALPPPLCPESTT